jgi:hypothetical protein
MTTTQLITMASAFLSIVALTALVWIMWRDSQ